MTKFLFMDYLESEENFYQCELFWDDEFSRITQELGVSDEWSSFGTSGNILKDGTLLSAVVLSRKFSALTTILRKASKKNQKVLLITQINALKFDLSRIYFDYKFIEHSIEMLPLETGVTMGNVQVMHIRVLLTEDSLLDVQKLISSWVAPPTGLASPIRPA